MSSSTNAAQIIRTVAPYTPYLFSAASLAIGQTVNVKSAMSYLSNDSNPFNNTINYSELARQGKLNRAYGRKSEIAKVIEELENGVAILVGPSGCGKSVIVEEITWRIENGEIPSLYGNTVFGLKLRKAQGDAGVKGAIENFLKGGVQERVRKLIDHILYQTQKGKQIILFIDEIQDILQHDITLLNPFKEELARNGIKLIGATTDSALIQKLRNQTGDGAGMARRIEAIQIQEMSKKDAETVICALIDTLKKEYQKKHGFDFEFDADTPYVVVELAKERYSDRILPDSAVCFLKALCAHYYNECSSSSNKTITTEDVVDYIAFITGRSKAYFQVIVRRLINKDQFNKTFSSTYFPLLKSFPTKIPFIVDEAKRLSIFFEDSKAPFYFIKGNSKVLQFDIISRLDRYKVYKCDLANLVHGADNQDGYEALSKFLEDVQLEKGSKIFALENCRLSWFDVKEEIPPVRQVVSPSSPLVKIADQGFSELNRLLQTDFSSTQMLRGLNPPPTPEKKRDPTPKIIDQFFDFIRNNRLQCLVLTNSPTDITPCLQIKEFASNECTEWLRDRVVAHGGKDPEDIELDKITLALHLLKDPLISEQDLAACTVDILVQSEVYNLESALLKVFRGKKTSGEIRGVLKSSETLLQNNPFRPLAPSGYAHFDTSIKNGVHHLLASRKSSILYVSEKSEAYSAFIKDQIADYLQSIGKGCILYDYSLLKDILPGPRSFLYERYLTGLDPESVILLDESGLQDEMIQKILAEKPRKVICFRSPPKSNGTAILSTEMTSLVDKGVQLIQRHLPGVIPTEPSSPARTEIPLPLEKYPQFELNISQPSSYVPALISYFAHLKGADEALCLKIQSLYTLMEKSDIDHIIELLNQDFAWLQTEDICQRFTDLYGKELGMTLNDVKYRVDPFSVSRRYKIQRRSKLFFKRIYQLAAFPIALISAYATRGIVTIIGGWIANRMMPSFLRFLPFFR